MPRKGQRSITISENTYNEIERLVGQNKDLFTNPTQFIKHALTELMIKVKTMEKL